VRENPLILPSFRISRMRNGLVNLNEDTA